MDNKKVYVVTGSANGIGAATALALARSGAAVVVNYSKSADKAEQVAAECRAAGGHAIAVQADVSIDADCHRLATAALDKWQRIDGLVNNAGTTKFASMRKLDLLSAEDFQRIYAINVVGAYQMVRACQPALRAAHGAVVNVSSIAGSIGLGSSIAYACSKGALNTLTLCLARSMGPEIRVNGVLPGFTSTGWLEEGLGAENFAKAQAGYRAAAALESTLLPEEVAANIVWLLQAPQVTGQLLTVDAGRSVGKV